MSNDNHAYVELLFGGAPQQTTFIESTHYSFDIAGIEGATPEVLSFLWGALAYLVTAVVFMFTRLARSVNFSFA